MNAPDEWIEVRVADRGRPAPREAVRRKRLRTPSADRLKPGGLGVQLIYRAFDEVEFAQGEGKGNTIAMRVRKPRKQ